MVTMRAALISAKINTQDYMLLTLAHLINSLGRIEQAMLSKFSTLTHASLKKEKQHTRSFSGHAVAVGTRVRGVDSTSELSLRDAYTHTHIHTHEFSRSYRWHHALACPLLAIVIQY